MFSIRYTNCSPLFECLANTKTETCNDTNTTEIFSRKQSILSDKCEEKQSTIIPKTQTKHLALYKTLNQKQRLQFHQANLKLCYILNKQSSIFGNSFRCNYFKSFDQYHPVCLCCKLYPVDLDYVNYCIKDNQDGDIEALCLFCVNFFGTQTVNPNPNITIDNKFRALFISNNPRKKAELVAYYDIEAFKAAKWLRD